MSTLPFTFFDTPRRTSGAAIAKTARQLAQLPIVNDMLEAFPTAALLLDRNRQVVAANRRALAAFDAMTIADVHGLRLGEALGCVCANKMEAGCGTSKNCAECGAARAIRGARSGSPVTQECRVTVSSDGRQQSLDFRTVASPVTLAGHSLVLVALEDISHEKRREALERIFFHDVLGAANAVHGLARLVADDDPERAGATAQSLLRASGQLLEEIQAQRDLMLAERGELATRVDECEVDDLLTAVCEQYRWSALAEDRELVHVPLTAGRRLRVDTTQLVRSLGNLVRNALEATPAGGRVSVSARPMAEGVLFQVANPGVIPSHLQLQVFQRSFSTKAARGRGIGTYSVKLIVEQYLMGRVSFVSSPDEGTVFSIWVPDAGVAPQVG